MSMNEDMTALAQQPELGDPDSTAVVENFYKASQWQLIWWRFGRHRLAMLALVVLGAFYLIAMLNPFISPYPITKRNSSYIYAPPQRIRLFHEGKIQARPFVYGLKGTVDPETLRRVYVIDQEKVYPVRLFVKSEPYKVLHLFPMQHRLFGVEEKGGTIFLMGTDRLGRDLFSRILSGSAISLSIGLVSVFLSLTIGCVLGGLAGFYGGWVDNVIQRIIEMLQSIPTIPLWLGLSAALPRHWTPIQTYFTITLVLSIIGWTGLARRVRGHFLAIREEDFVLSARLAGCTEMQIILLHMLPSFLSYIIVSITLSIPQMILSETSLSFLGLGLRPPTVSWGVLLQDAQNLSTLAMHPWLLFPGLFVVIAVLAFNFLGDGLRDAADPYGGS